MTVKSGTFIDMGLRVEAVSAGEVFWGVALLSSPQSLRMCGDCQAQRASCPRYMSSIEETKVNSRERLLCTIAGEPTDRPTVSPFLHTNFIKEFRECSDVDVIAETVLVYQELGFDLIHRNCTPEYDDFLMEGPDWESCLTETGDATARSSRSLFALLGDRFGGSPLRSAL